MGDVWKLPPLEFSFGEREVFLGEMTKGLEKQFYVFGCDSRLKEFEKIFRKIIQ